MATPIPTGRQITRGRTGGLGGDTRQITPGDVQQVGVGRDPGVSINANQFGAQVGQGLQQLAGGLQDVANVQKGLEVKRKGLEDNAALSQFQNEYNLALTEAYNEAKVNATSADGFVTGFAEQYTDLRQQALDNVKERFKFDENLQLRADAVAGDLEARFSTAGVTFEHNERVAMLENNLNDEIEADITQVSIDGDIESARARVSERMELHKTLFEPSTFEKMKDAQDDALAAGAVEWAKRSLDEMGANNPGRARQLAIAINKGEVDTKNLSPHEQLIVAAFDGSPLSRSDNLRILNAVKSRALAVSLRESKKAEADALAEAAVNDGKITADTIERLNSSTAGLDPTRRQFFMEDFQEKLSLVQDVEAFKNLDPADQAARVQELSTQISGENAAENLTRLQTFQNVVAARRKAVVTDAYSFVAQEDDDVNAALELVDPDLQNTDPQNINALTTAVDMSIQAQKDVRALPSEIRVMPKTTATDLAGRLKEAKSAEEVIGLIALMKTRHPEHFDLAMRNLVDAGADSALLALEHTPDIGMAQELVTAIAVANIEKADFFKLGDTKKSKLDGAVIDELSLFNRSTLAGNIKERAAMNRAVRLMSAERIKKQGKSASDAAEEVTDDMFDKSFGFIENGGSDGTVIKVPLTKADPDEVRTGIVNGFDDLFRSTLTRDNISLINIDEEREATEKQITVDDVRDFYFDVTINNPRIVNSPDGDGVNVLNQTGHFVMIEEDGEAKPLFYSWIELVTAGIPQGAETP